jgi:hypothetical protein
VVKLARKEKEAACVANVTIEKLKAQVRQYMPSRQR